MEYKKLTGRTCIISTLSSRGTAVDRLNFILKFLYRSWPKSAIIKSLLYYRSFIPKATLLNILTYFM
jgi:hypothetical protein